LAKTPMSGTRPACEEPNHDGETRVPTQHNFSN
jgi:hypothetical protein